MKKRVQHFLPLFLLILAVGLIPPLNALGYSSKLPLLSISESDFYFMDAGWLSELNHDYENDPYWCRAQDKSKLYDTLYMKYKLSHEPKEHYLNSINAVGCKLYDGALQINLGPGAHLNDYNIVPVAHTSREPAYIMTLNFIGLALNKNHNLHACCSLQHYNLDTKRFEIISNEVCFSKEIPRVKCAR